MKELMLGNKAVARGLYEAGVCVASSYPGTPSTETTEEAAKFPEIYCEWAPNEKVALETAFGACLAGKRSYCAMKHVGLNVAADPLYTISYTGVNAGMVILVADDPGMHSSQNEQDSRHHAIASKIPMVEPADSAEALAFVKKAYEISEEFDTPVLFRICTRIAHCQSIVETSDRVVPPVRPYVKDVVKNAMVPANAKIRHPIVEERTRKLIEYGETCDLNRVEKGTGNVGIITSGTCYQYVKEVFGDTVSVLKLGLVNPLPVKIIKDFAASVEKLYVIEELDPIIENHVRALGIPVRGKEIFPMEDEFSQTIVAEKMGCEEKPACKAIEGLPGRPPAMCPGCPHRGLFYALSKNKIRVFGDIGCYALGAAPPLSAIDTIDCMGASINALHGFNKATEEESSAHSVAVLGDSTFMHSGMTGLANVAYNQSNSTTIILDNSITGMTGHQQNPTTGFNLRGEPAGKIDLESLCKAMGIEHVRVVDPYDLESTEKVILEELKTEAPSVVISRRPCVLLKNVKHKPPVSINPDKCRGCKSCMRIGCPAISFRNGKASIDSSLCVGCSVCTQLCRFDAFEIPEGGNE
ncbi:MAG: indolepyruvate ferredoxin oxidoreductase subunit alpha [Lachnospiraceae bacterium]|nr:indolepyruvate ferredoxin oxidoreductase subunit alpha [Lachnospiraceae bacterium]